MKCISHLNSCSCSRWAASIVVASRKRTLGSNLYRGSRRCGWDAVLQATIEQIVCGCRVTNIVVFGGIGALIFQILIGLDGLGQRVGRAGRIGGNVIDHRDISLSLNIRRIS